MKYVNTHGLSLSAFSLGTVQLGLTYGLGADSAKPSEEKAQQILDSAMEVGVNTLDTASGYGDSEEIIGRWMAKRRAEGKELPWVVTKISQLDHSSYDALRDDMFRRTEKCMQRLGVDSIDCMMLHVFDDYLCDRDNVRKVFEELKAQKMIRYSAASAYSHHDYGEIADTGFDATQIPMNIFDWLQIENGGMEKLEKSGMMVFVRSVFLQGMVFHTPQTLDPRLDFCIPYLTRFCGLCEKYGLDPAVLALSFVMSVPGVTATVLGCDNADQVRANCDLFDKLVTLTPAQMEEIHDAFRDIDRRMVNPSVWFK